MLSGLGSYFHRLKCIKQDIIGMFKKQRATEENLDNAIIFDEVPDVNDTELLTEAIDILLARSNTTAMTLSVAPEQLLKAFERFAGR